MLVCGKISHMNQFKEWVKNRPNFIFVLAIICTFFWACSKHYQIRRSSFEPLMVQKKIHIPKNFNVTDFLKTALNYRGIRYRYGGNTVKGADCSGFTQLVFRSHGMTLPHSSSLQSRYGRYISKDEKLIPGDLVFFQTYKRGPSHVGIFLGKNRFIHSSYGRKKVIISSMNSTYYQTRYLGAKRFFD